MVRPLQLSLLMFSMTVACSGGGGGAGGAGGAGTSTSTSTGTSASVGTCTTALATPGTLGSPDAGTECHSLVNCAEEVEFQTASGAAPAPAAGALADGLYALTAVRVYGTLAPPGVKVRVTQLLQGTTVYGVASSQGGPDGHVTGTISISGTNITDTHTCPDSGAQPRQYSFDGSVWLDFDIDSDRTVVYEYTLVK